MSNLQKKSEKTGLLELKNLARRENRSKHPNVPLHAIPEPKYSERTANGLTKCIIDFVRLKKFQCERVSIVGRFIDNRKVVNNVIGQRRTIGSSKWIPSSMQKGSADISATIQGRSVKVEVKIRLDRQSEAQKLYQEQVENSGGLYFIARDFQSFYQWYQATFEEGGHNVQ